MKPAAAKWIVGSMLVFFLTAIWAESAHAIPPFARKYRTSCQTCHVMIFKRHSFGEAFRRNGFRLPVDDELAVKEDPVSLGAEAWKKMWPDIVWPGTIPGTIPIGFYSHQRFTWAEERPGETKVDTTFDMPHELELFLGGTFGENLSFFGEWIVFEHGKTGDSRLGAMFIQYNDLFGLEDVLNVKFGRSDISALDGYNAFKEDNRLTLAHYLPNDYKVVPSKDVINGDSINFRWNLRTKQPGIEINGIVADRYEYAIGVVNGNGSVSDTDDQKDWHYRVSAKLLGDTMTMRDVSSDLKIRDNWRDDSVTIGTFGYIGSTELSTSRFKWDNEFTRFGVDMRAKYDRFELGTMYVWGNDDDPGGPPALTTANNRNIDSSSWMVEASAIVYPWLIPTIRYEETNFDKNFANDVERIVINLNVLQFANVRWTVEWGHFFDDEDGGDTVKVNLLYAF